MVVCPITQLYRLQSHIVGSLAVKVDAHYTSQACPCCGHTSKENRPNKGLTFVCQQCGHTLHADLVGARMLHLECCSLARVGEYGASFSRP
jgi:transposase